MSPTTLNAAIRRLLIGVCLIATAGCYSGERLIEQVRMRSIRTRLDEVEIGSFRVTLPPDSTGDLSEIDVRVFGEAARYRISELEKELAEKRPLLGDLATRMLREVDQQELIDPDLTSLRERLLATVNSVLDGEPIHAVGFYDVSFTRH